MKLKLILLFVTASFSPVGLTAPCPDLAGIYTCLMPNSDRMVLTVTQREVSGVEEYQLNKQVFITDGQERSSAGFPRTVEHLRYESVKATSICLDAATIERSDRAIVRRLTDNVRVDTLTVTRVTKGGTGVLLIGIEVTTPSTPESQPASRLVICAPKSQ